MKMIMRTKIGKAFILPILRTFVDGATVVFKEQVEQDIPIWENKIYLDTPLLCDGDGSIRKYRKWFSQFYA